VYVALLADDRRAHAGQSDGRCRASSMSLSSLSL
jgi:hypothetical protein